jgi:hypothetical protein
MNDPKMVLWDFGVAGPGDHYDNPQRAPKIHA